MKKPLLCLFVALLSAACLKAAPLTVCDFESYEIGTSWTMWNVYSSSPVSTATVEADPTNPSNKVRHLRRTDWHCYPGFGPPTESRRQYRTNHNTTLTYKL